MSEERDSVRERLLEHASADEGIAAAANTGSYVSGGGDELVGHRSLAFAVRGELTPALDRWTELLYQSFAAIHHWDLPFGSTVYRMFLLPNCLEVDIAFTPEAEFGPRGPNWRTVFGETVELAQGRPSARDGSYAGTASLSISGAYVPVCAALFILARW